MKIITRDIVNKQLHVTGLTVDDDNNVLTNVSTYSDVMIRVNIAKNYLLKQRNCRPGQKVILANFFWPDYLSWYFACAELGIIFVVSDYPKSEAGLTRLAIYGDIDYIIYDHHYPKGFAKLTDKLIDSNKVFREFTDDSESPVLVTEDSIFMLSTSSGTTGTPKLITHTHSFFASLLERNAELYKLKNDQKCFHSKGLHHGSVTGVYFLPMIKYCANHYHAPFKFLLNQNGSGDYHVDTKELVKAWVELIQIEKIDMCLMFYDQIECLNEFLDINKKHDNLIIYVLSKVKPNVVNNLVGKFGYTIKSIFGCTETSGPLFLPTITPTNYVSFDYSNCGTILDNFYTFRLTDNNLLEVEMPDSTRIVTGDKFAVDNGEYIFCGRENLYRIKGQTLYIDLLNSTVEEITNLKKEVDFDIVIDQEYQQIYIRSNFDLNLEHVNRQIGILLGTSNYQISKKIVKDRSEFFSGIKFDPESIRLYCRNL
jgi:acyl-CoA synthetase (AMP-forming)/AMP-acid ligase II